MKTIVKDIGNFSYKKFQPGDGTLYTVLHGRIDEEIMYIALGSGDYTGGGYFYRVSSARQMVIDMVKYINDGGSPTQFQKEYHLCAYVASKINFMSEHPKVDWTVIVTVLFAAIYALSDASNGDAYSLIPAVYYGSGDMVLQWVYDWSDIDEDELD